MKSKKRMLIIGLLALVLVLGIGYAAVSVINMSITGTADVEDTVLRVRFDEKSTGAITVNKNAGASYDYGSVDNGNYTKIEPEIEAEYSRDSKPLTATMTVSGLTYEEQAVSATYTIVNYERDLSAEINKGIVEIEKLAPDPDDGSTPLGTAEDFYDVKITDVNDNDLPLTIPPKQSKKVKVTVTLKKLPITESDSKVEFTIPLIATPKHPTP